jgi:hypothetical protein
VARELTATAPRLATTGCASYHLSVWSSGHASRRFPPYQLLERGYLEEAQEKYRRLEHLYHKTHDFGWDGRKVLRDLIAQHGGIQIPRAQREHLARIFSIILWGELAAWNVSADLALALEDVEAKMAATGQVFDEARHFYTMRDYLLELEVDIPPLDGYTLAVLRELQRTTSLTEKLLGMQLLVENIAVVLFRTIAEAKLEPVLSGLMPYFERDEARHVGLGVLYLPRMLDALSHWEAARLQAFQLRLNTLIIWGTRLLRPHFEALGVDNTQSLRRGLRMQAQALCELRGAAGHRVRGVLSADSAVEERLNSLSIDLFFPPLDAEQPSWQRVMLRGLYRAAQVGDHVLRWVA